MERGEDGKLPPLQQRKPVSFGDQCLAAALSGRPGRICPTIGGVKGHAASAEPELVGMTSPTAEISPAKIAAPNKSMLEKHPQQKPEEDDDPFEESVLGCLPRTSWFNNLSENAPRSVLDCVLVVQQPVPRVHHAELDIDGRGGFCPRQPSYV